MTRLLSLATVTALFAAPGVPAPAYRPPVDAAMSSRASRPGASLSVERAEDGLFRLAVTRAGRSIPFVVDTGATMTVLTSADARRLGVRTDRGEVTDILTANGVATMQRVWLEGLSVAGRPLPPVEAAIAPAGLTHSLLGQDALARLGRLTLERDRLELGGEAARSAGR